MTGVSIESLMAPEAPELDDILNRPPWHQRAACRGVGSDAFVLSNSGCYSRRALCDDCPVRRDCLEVALADDLLVGLWGGTTDADRRERRRGRAAA
jgi:WhiB family transcriptional regulator, redox-sensing transcriptional regulator